MRLILGALYSVIAEGRPRRRAPLAWIASHAVRRATIATMPRWQRDLGGLRQSRLIDAAIKPMMRLIFPWVARSSASELKWLGILSPATLPVMEPVVRGIAPSKAITLTPAQAFARHAVPTPRQAYAQALAREGGPATWRAGERWNRPAASGTPASAA
jgi:hypothetical protein